MDQWVVTLLSVLGGGSIVALINAIANRRKNNSDITQSNIETALKLRDEALTSYSSTEAKLQACRELLDEAESDLRQSREYINQLEALLDEHHISYAHLLSEYERRLRHRHKDQ